MGVGGGVVSVGEGGVVFAQGGGWGLDGGGHGGVLVNYFDYNNKNCINLLW